MSEKEHKSTAKARERIKIIYELLGYKIEEFVPITVQNNIGDQEMQYEADMILTKQFIVEFDSKKLHGTRVRRIKDSWRDKNIHRETDLKTIRLISKELLKVSDEQIIDEVDYQFNNQ